MKFILFILGILFISCTLYCNETLVTASSLSLNRATLCSNVIDREPIDKIYSFEVGGSVFLFTEFLNVGTKKTIVHTWYYSNGFDYKKYSSVPLTVEGPKYRTWSYITPKTEGNWKVVVSDHTGTTLSETEFEVFPKTNYKELQN